MASFPRLRITLIMLLSNVGLSDYKYRFLEHGIYPRNCLEVYDNVSQKLQPHSAHRGLPLLALSLIIGRVRLSTADRPAIRAPHLRMSFCD